MAVQDIMFNRFVIYSSEQKKEMETIAKNSNKTFKLGTVIVNGKSKPYTDIILSMNNCKYGDAKIVIAGDIRKLSITEPIR